MKTNRNFRMLNDETFLDYALLHYEKRGGITFDNLNNDLKDICFINQSMRRYDKENKFNTRKVINNIIIAYNTFKRGFIDVLFYKIDNEFHVYLTTLLYYIGFINDNDNLVIEYGVDIKLFNYIENEIECAE